MGKILVVPVTVLLIGLAVATFLLLPHSERGGFIDPVVEAPQSAMPVPADAPEEIVSEAPMGNADESLSAAPASNGSVMPKAITKKEGEADAFGGERWVLIWLGDEAVPEGDRAPNIVFEQDAGRVNGYAGCNRYSGTFTIDDKVLSFGPLMSTRMACDQLALEGVYMRALKEAVQWRFSNGVLSFRDKKGAEIARFKRP